MKKYAENTEPKLCVTPCNINRVELMDKIPQDWYSRGYLPHRNRTSLLQSITFRFTETNFEIT